jgi:S1-C subfamily serine protease
MGMPREQGALIFSPSGKQGLAVIANSPAEKAGLRINDIILAVGDETVDLDHSLSSIVSKYKKSEEAEFLVLREGQELKIKLVF